MSAMNIPSGRRFDIACLGRLAVDLYAQQVGCPLEDATSFAKYLGGSSANIAFGAARLGQRAAMISPRISSGVSTSCTAASTPSRTSLA